MSLVLGGGSHSSADIRVSQPYGMEDVEGIDYEELEVIEGSGYEEQ